MPTRSEFERQLSDIKFKATGKFSDDGLTQLWRKPDGELVAISVHDSYPDYILDKILEECGLYWSPLYDSNA